MASNCEEDQKAPEVWKVTMTKLWVVANIMAIVGIVILGLLFYSEFQIHKNKALGGIVDLQIELEILKERVMSYEKIPDDRFRRQVENLNSLSQDGVALPAEGSNSGEGRISTEGLRIYDAWFQDSRGIPKNRRRGRNGNVEGQGSGPPIRPHHRQSASWVEHRRKSKHDLNTHFDQNNIYRDPYPSGGSGKRNQGPVDLPDKNRAKETDRENPSNSNILENSRPRGGSLMVDGTTNFVSHLPTKRVVSFSASRTSTTTSSNSSSHLNQGGHQKQQKPHGKNLHQNRNRLGEAREFVASASSTNVRSLRPSVDEGSSSVGPIKDQFHGLLSAHFQGKQDRSATFTNNNPDGVFRVWDMARWAKKMNLFKEFIYDESEGTVVVSMVGVYYIYAQVNYLDENDVNAFQMLVNGEPYLLCTTMTHTRGHSITKANTCYTGGVVYLEKGDKVSVRDLESGRKSVIRPAHTFFGLVQLSGLDV